MSTPFFPVLGKKILCLMFQGFFGHGLYFGQNCDNGGTAFFVEQSDTMNDASPTERSKRRPAGQTKLLFWEGGMPDESDGKVDYRAAIREAVGSAHDDKWAERTHPNTGAQLTPDMLNVPADFAADYAESMNERYGR
jgi:hypothetical protein